MEWHLLTSFQRMQEHIQERTRQLLEMERQLREREEQYRSIFESSTDAIAIVTLEGQVVEVNPATCKAYGYSYEEMIGMSPANLVHPDSIPRVAESLQKMAAGGQDDSTYHMLRKDGTTFPIEAHSVQFTYKGKPHVLAITRDISERVKAEQQLREREGQYRAIFETTTDGLFITDLERRPDC